MTTAANPPFAYGYDGALLVTADGPELLVHDGADEAPKWRRTLGAAVMGVGVTEGAVVAVDATGEVVACDRGTGEVLRTVALGRLASDLAASKAGRVAVLGASTAVVLRVSGDEARVEIEAPGATAVAIDPEGKRVAIGDGEGRVRVLDAGSGKERGATQILGPAREGADRAPAAAVEALAWSPRGHWIASTTRGLARVDAGGGDFRGLVDTDDLKLGPLACSEDGAICAVRVGTSKVALFDLLDFKLQGVVQYERTVGKVAFGPGAWLGIALDEGDANKVDLLTGMVHRTDPHEGRPRNTWVLVADPRSEQIAAVMKRAAQDPGGKKARKPSGAALANAAPEEGVSWWAVGAVVLLALGVLLKLLL